MSIKVTSWVWDHSTYEGTKLLLLLALADFCDDGGVCYPGVTRIATKARTGVRNAQSIIRQMEASDDLRVDIGAGIMTDHGPTNRYHLLGFQRAHGVIPTAPRGVIPTAPGDPHCTPGVIPTAPHGVITTAPKPSVEPSVEPSVFSSGSNARAEEIIFPSEPLPRPNIFAVYEANIGLLTPIIANHLTDAVATYPVGWVDEAIAVAVTQNKRSWAYAAGVLKRWERDGKDNKPVPTKTATPPKAAALVHEPAPLTSPFNLPPRKTS